MSLDAADANALEEVNSAYENVKEVECLDISKEGCESWDAAVKRYDERIGNKYLLYDNKSYVKNIKMFYYRSG